MTTRRAPASSIVPFAGLMALIVASLALPVPGVAGTIYAGTQRGIQSGRVLMHAGGTTWADISPPIDDIEAVWDLEWFEGALWASGGRQYGAPFVARWDGTSWQTWGWPVFWGPVTALAVVDGTLYASDRYTGLHVWDGVAWSSSALVSPERSARMTGDGCGAAEPLVLIGSDLDDSFAAYDPTGRMSCGASCPDARGGCGAGCYGGSCIHSMTLHDDGAGLVAWAGAYEGRIYRWDGGRNIFDFAPRVPSGGHVQGLVSHQGALMAGASDAALWRLRPGTSAWTLVRTWDASLPVSALESDRETGLLWIGHGGVPFGQARSDGTSLVETWDGTTLTPMGAAGAFDGGVVSLLVAPDEGAAECGVGPDQVVECAGDATPVQLEGWGRDPATGCVGGPGSALAWSGPFSEATASGPRPVVHFAGPGDYVVTLRTGASAAAECTVRVQVVDRVAPRIRAPASIRLACSSPLPPATLPAATDACDDAPAVTLAETREDGPCPFAWLVVRTWTATDASGNQSVAQQRITFTDDDAPVLSAVPAPGRVTCDAVPPPASPAATDACDPAPVITFEERRIDGPCPGTYGLVRTWTATDACGNAAPAQQVLEIVDEQPPVLAGVPSDARVACDAVPPPASPAATDACDPAPVITFEERRIDGPCPSTYRLVRTWTATDACGNAAPATQVLDVADEQPPVMSGVPADARVACFAVPPPASPSASDACDAAPVITFDERRIDGPCPSTYRLVRTWAATDACGNAAPATQVLDVADEQPPVLSGVPADARVACFAVPPSASPSASDACDAAPVITFAERRIDGPCPSTYRLLRTWTATDACGNAASATQALDVVDEVPPVVQPGSSDVACTWPPNHAMVTFTKEDFTVRAEDDCIGDVTWRLAGCASDQPDDGLGDGSTEADCVVLPGGSAIAVRSERQGGAPAGRRYAVTVVATDACGNASTPTIIGYVHVPHDQRDQPAGCRGARGR